MTKNEKYLISIALEEAYKYLLDVKCRTLLMSKYLDEFEGVNITDQDRAYHTENFNDCVKAMEFIKGLDLYDYKMTDKDDCTVVGDKELAFTDALVAALNGKLAVFLNADDYNYKVVGRKVDPYEPVFSLGLNCFIEGDIVHILWHNPKGLVLKEE